jgi:hypothetical protein
MPRSSPSRRLFSYKYVTSIFFAITLLAPAVDASDTGSRAGSHPYISSSQSTLVWSIGPLELVETNGDIVGSEEYTKGFSKYSREFPDGLAVDIYSPSFTPAQAPDAEQLADFTDSAFRTIIRMAGRPPVKQISIYVVPSGNSFHIKQKSWSVRKRHNTSYALTMDTPDIGRSLVRTVAHELFHTWVGIRQTSQENNELGAVTMENCAEIDAFASARQLDKSIVNDSARQGLASQDSAAHFTLEARYGRDLDLDGMFSNGVISKGDEGALLIENLCRVRATKARH